MVVSRWVGDIPYAGWQFAHTTSHTCSQTFEFLPLCHSLRQSFWWRRLRGSEEVLGRARISCCGGKGAALHI